MAAPTTIARISGLSIEIPANCLRAKATPAIVADSEIPGSSVKASFGLTLLTLTVADMR
jgi:hypothetical protein